MQVPNFESLPAVASARPEVTPQKGVDRFERQQLGEPGLALEGTGKAVEGDAMDATRIADGMAQQQNEVAQKTAATTHQQNVNNLGYVSMGTGPDGKPLPAFYSLKGQDAVNALPQYTAAIQASQVAGGQGLSQQAKIGYDAQTQQDMAREVGNAQRFGMVQGQDAATQAGVARIGAAATTALNNPNETDNSLLTIHSEAVDEARRAGQPIGGDFQTQYEQAHRSPMLKAVVAKQLDTGDVQGAAANFAKYGPLMSPTDNVEMQGRLKGPLLQWNAQKDGDHLIGPQTSPGAPTGNPGMDQPYQTGAGYYDAVHGGEGNGVNAKTGASGPVQIIPGTAAAFHAAPGNADIDLNTEAGGRAFTKWYGDQNAQKISEVTGQPATVGQVVSAHLLGPGGATAILSRPDEPIGTTLGKAAVENNPGPLPGGVSMTGREAQKSIADYYAKAAGNQFAGPGAPTGSTTSAAALAAEKPPRPDFEGAIGAVPLLPQDPERQAATIRYIEQRKAQYDMGEATERDELTRPGTGTLAKTATALENGAVNTPIPELAIRRALGPQAGAALAGLDDAKAQGALSNANKYATPEAINTQFAALKARISPENTDANDVAQAVKDLDMLQKVTARNNEALKADPFSYVASEPTVAAAFAQAKQSGDPEDVARAIRASQAKQAYLGAPAPQAISTAGIQQNVAAIHQAPVEAVPQMMAKLRAQYGSAWPDVFRDLSDPAKGKLDPTYQTFATIAQNGASPIDYAAALKSKNDKAEKFGAAVPGADKALMETRLTSNMQAWQDTFPPGVGDGLIAGQLNSARTLATYYMEDRGKTAKEAADAAYQVVIGDNMTMDGNLRVPKMVEGRPLTVDAVQQAGQGEQSRLTDADMQHDKDGKIVTTAAQAKNGKWVTNQDGMSAVLQVPNTDGSWRYARRADGSPITIDYRRLPAAQAVETPAIGNLQ